MGASLCWLAGFVTVTVGFEPAAQKLNDEPSAVAAIKALGGKVKRDNKKQGNPVVEVSFDFEKWKELDLTPLKDLPELHSVSLVYVRLSAQNLKGLKGLPKLDKLSLLLTGIKDDDFKIIGGMRQMRSLAIGFADIFDGALSHLDHLKELTQLELSGTSVTDDGIAKLQKALPRLSIKAGNRNTADKRVRRFFGIPHSEKVSEKTIRSAILGRLKPGASEEQVYEYLKKCGIGRDDLNRFFPLKEGTIVCRIELDPDSGPIVHVHYGILFNMDHAKTFKDVTVKCWLTGP